MERRGEQNNYENQLMAVSIIFTNCLCTRRIFEPEHPEDFSADNSYCIVVTRRRFGGHLKAGVKISEKIKFRSARCIGKNRNIDALTKCRVLFNEKFRICKIGIFSFFFAIFQKFKRKITVNTWFSFFFTDST